MFARYGGPAALFAIKCYLSAILALFVALSIGLSNPYWAVTTSFVIAQPFVGAVLSKALFRVVGTVGGAVAAVVLVPNLANAPELLSLAMALWLGLCVYVSLLDRTPRSYMFMLAGYSACIIGLPSVAAPGAVFDVAILRVQEITIGIMCGSLVHGVLFPRSVTDMLFQRVNATLRDAERWSHDSLSGQAIPGLDAERRRLALDITEMHQLSSHLPFETARVAPRVRTVQALQYELSQILPLTVAVEDRLVALTRHRGELPAPISDLLNDCRAWLNNPDSDPVRRDEQVEMLRARAAALEPEAMEGMGWDAALRLNLLARLASLIGAHRDCRDLRDQMESPTSRPITPRIAELLASSRDPVFHRDHAAALRAALGAALTLTISCALWIASGWHDGAGAVMLAGVFLAMLSSSDDPIAPLRMFFTGTLVAMVIGAIYGFVIMPRLDGFAMLATAFAPVLLIGGAVMTSPRHAMVAMAAMMGLAGPVLLAARYQANFAAFMNGNISMLMGLFMAIVMIRLLQSAGLDGAINRTLKAGWNDIASRATLDSPPNLPAWISRMLDRIGLLAPRLAARGDDPGQPLFDALRDLRTGLVIGELRQLRRDLPRDEGSAITPVLEDVGDHYARMEPDTPPHPAPAMLRHIDTALARLAGNTSPSARRTGVLALTSLRCTLFPDARPYREVPA